ncbi:lytic murein transglycosylase [Microvirga tunisiensis]|uniref:Lytic murein transglycosylase n=2 Tax=Pannonibacter tanglangensis TaxID=2750084 RepID=A0A7X5F5Q8_9HYPH|nr:MULTISPECIES: lytic murein transglycosylase [unclassified Pannonibacter]NBN65774.1 lytic murein transglycosylase [Pannonibacter sp. XCT-34]NBN79999.1 lytic murein transglycosylase [Pannonibacter sp. XCT-53]
MRRPVHLVAALCALVSSLALVGAPAPARADYDTEFATFLAQTVIPAARAAGVPQSVLDRELRSLTPDTGLPGLGRPDRPEAPPKVDFQAEFRAPGGYFKESQFRALAGPGRTLAQKHAATLKAIEARYGVPGRIVLAIWARETGYGAARIPHDGLRVVATRAFMGDRRAFFLGETVAALQILADGHISRAELRSSWGGAMGQPQFLPSSFLTYAVDFDGDGKRDIWRSVPDTLASIANYLKEKGWVAGRDWGYEIALPASVSCTREGPDRRQRIADFVAEGVTRASGRPFPERELAREANLLLPAGRLGPAFLATENFYVLKAYNESDVYALFVGHLADRYGSDAGFVGRWQDTPHLSRGAVRDLQLKMEKAGYDVGGADGLIGFKTRRSLGMVQEQAGRTATCWLD